MTIAIRMIALAALLVASLPAAAQADPVADFYRGKTVRLIVGYPPGGNYDLYGRLAVEFLGRHIPGKPTVIGVNMPGAGGFRAIEYLYKVAPQDGTHLGTVAQQLALTLLVDNKWGIDPTRFTYVGRIASNIDIAVALPKAGIKSFEDARKRELTVGAGNTSSTSAVFARALNVYAGAKFKIVTGYRGTAEIQLAVERGEIEVNGSESLAVMLASHPDWLSGKAVILYQSALKRFPKIPQVPTMLELASSDEGRAVMRALCGTAEVGRSVLTTPGVPPERLKALRTAFAAMVKDPEFLAAVEKRKIMIDPATGEQLDALTRDTMKLPKETVAALQKLLKG
ncbi:MAG: Bug family tripartite tricarboxylate transporter substrate binding protein [Xanthobacteraceae bacterium]